MRRNPTAKRKLGLRIETLRALSEGELGLAAGEGASLSGSVKCTLGETDFCAATRRCTAY